MTFDAVGVFGLTFDFLLKIWLSILCKVFVYTLDFRQVLSLFGLVSARSIADCEPQLNWRDFLFLQLLLPILVDLEDSSDATTTTTYVAFTSQPGIHA